MWAFLARLILRNKILFLILVSILTVFMGWRAVQVELSYEMARTLPEADQNYIDYVDFKKRFGEDGAVFAIGIQPKDIFSLKLFQDWYDLNDKIRQIDGIEEVVSLTRILNVVKNDSLQKFEFRKVVEKRPETQEQLDSIRKTIEGLHFYDSLIYHPGTKATLILITLDRKKLNTKNRIAMVDSITQEARNFGEKHHLQVHFSGLPYIRTAITRMVSQEMILFILLAIGVTTIILFLFFRSFNAVFFSLLVVLVGVTWSFGSMELLGYKISILTGLIPPLIIIIGVPNCILLLNKYQMEFARHGNKVKALARMIHSIGMTTFLANVTSGIGFGVFYFTNSKLLMEFGVVAALNVMLTYVISLILIPVIFSFLPPPKVKHLSHLQNKYLTRLLGKIDFWVHHKRRVIYVIVVVVMAISLYGTTQINTVGFIVDDLPSDHPVLVDLKFFESNFRGIMPFEISIDTRKTGGVIEDNAKVLYKEKALQKILAQYPEFSRSISLADFAKFVYQAYRDGNPKYFVLPPPTELNKINDYLENSIGDNGGKFRSFIDSTRQVTRVTTQMADVGSQRMQELLEELRPRIDSIFDPGQYDVKMTGNSVMFALGNKYLIQNLRESVFLAVILICFVMVGLFMSLRMITISVLPSVLPLIITAGLMGFFSIALKPSSILIFSIAFGIASDGTIYFLTKYRQELKDRKYGISKAVSLTIAETGLSMIYTAIILFAGFGIFAASKFGGTASLGILISLTLLIAYTSNLILLPTLLLSLEKRLTTKAFLSEPLIQVYDDDTEVEFDDLDKSQEEPGEINRQIQNP